LKPVAKDGLGGRGIGSNAEKHRRIWRMISGGSFSMGELLLRAVLLNEVLYE
jgi:hypothetical protein